MFKQRQKARKRRHNRIRKKVMGTAERPRLAVYKSLNHIAAQLIDDQSGRTLVGLSTGSGALKAQVKRGNKEGAQALGKLLAEQAKAQKINQAVFDRGGYIYHGRVRVVAEAAREAGLKI